MRRGVLALASDPRKLRKSGRMIGSWTLEREYGFTDRDGARPNWGKVFSRFSMETGEGEHVVASLLEGILVALAIAFAWSIGAHYTGACMGMPYAAGALRINTALLLMAPLALVGAIVASGRVEATVGHGILGGPQIGLLTAVVILAVSFGLTAAYNLVALPTSTIQLFTFSVVGVGLATGVPVQWSTVELLLLVWASAPFLAFGLGYVFVRPIDTRRSSISGPVRLTGAIAAVLVGVGAAASFAMGANDVSNASGPLVMTGLFGLVLAGLVGGIGLALGVLTWGRPLLRRVAFDIVKLDPQMAIGAQFAQATVILGFVVFGQFTSMNQALVGGMLGAGLARGQRLVQRSAVRGILIGWAIGPLSGGSLGFAVATSLVHAGWL
jgi:inorganic phosphate transporter, PiT family